MGDPLHFDSTDVFTNNLGQILKAEEFRTIRRKNVREIFIYFDAAKKYNAMSQTIVAATRFNRFKFGEVISEMIASFIQPRLDKMVIRTFRKEWHKLKPLEPES